MVPPHSRPPRTPKPTRRPRGTGGRGELTSRGRPRGGDGPRSPTSAGPSMESGFGTGKKPAEERSSKRFRTTDGRNEGESQRIHTSGTLDVVDFAVARAYELQALRAALREKRTSRRVYQALAWHARRRTMSHSARRMPRRYRALHAAQLAKVAAQNAISSKSKGSGVTGEDGKSVANAKDKPGPKGARIRRKYRGRSRFLSALRAVRLSRPGMLETHVWHAKRFHMTSVAGMRVASRCNDRGERSALRCAKRGCLGYEESFLRVLSVRADTPDLLVQGLRSIMSADDMRRLSSSRASIGERLVRAVVFNHNDQIVGPVDILRVPSAPVAWLWAHPALADDLQTILKVVNLFPELVSNQPGRFRLIGPSADRVLATALTLPPDFPQARTTATDVVLAATFHPTNSPSVSAPRTMQADADIWDPDTRTRILRPREHNTGSVSADVSIPVWVIQRGGDTGLYGWDIIVPKSWGLPLWLRLMYANRARAAGMEEIHALDVGRSSGPVFPEEFVDVSASRALIRARRLELLQRVAKRPPAKRPNVGLGLLAVLETVRASVIKSDDQTSVLNPAKRPRTSVSRLPSLTNKSPSSANIDAGDSIRIVRGICALRAALGCLTGIRAVTHTGTGCDEMFVAVFIRATGRGVPRRDAVVRLRQKSLKRDTVEEGASGSSETSLSGAIGAVVDGAFGLECGRGIGRALVSVSGLRTAACIGSASAKLRKVAVKGRCCSALPEIPVAFRNVRDNCVWRDAVVTVVVT